MTLGRLGDPNARVVIGHRGNPAHVPENTIESLRQARQLGVDAIEFDVRCTRDGVAVVIHDATLDRTTNTKGRVADRTAAELNGVFASDRSPTWKGPALPIPTLEQALDEFRDIPLIIEVKELRAADETERLVRRFGAQERVVIGSLEGDVMDRFERSGLITAASTAQALSLIPLALLGLTPPRPPYKLLAVPPSYRGIPMPVGTLVAVARRMAVHGIVWTINDPKEATKYWQLGASGIASDDPAAILRTRPQ